MSNKKLIGGSFAPPLSDEQLNQYETLAQSADRRVQEYMLDLVKMMRVFRETPESQLAGSPHPVRGTIVPLEDSEVERIWDVVPWAEECDVISDVFDAIVEPDLRNAAFHLLWFARELTKDREPLTNDRL